ncbi:MAG TPA: hypothetical protein VIM07_09370 [Chitinophagaceae bacterium]
MIYKFPKPANFFKGLLANYTGGYLQMCVPQTEDEIYCYVELSESQFPEFKEHFGDNGEILDNTDEYPANIKNKITNRIEKFTIVRPQNSDGRF